MTSLFLTKAYSLVELIIVSALVILLATAAMPMIANAITNTKLAQASDIVRSLNMAATTARGVDQVSGAGTIGSDKVAALMWYITYGYINQAPTTDLSNVDFFSGAWYVDVR